MAGAIAYISRDTDGKHWKKVLEAAFGPIDFRTIGSGRGTPVIRALQQAYHAAVRGDHPRSAGWRR